MASRAKSKWILTIIILVLLAVLVFLAIQLLGEEQVLSTAATMNLEGVTIVVDAGHGGSDPGTIGVATGGDEASVNLAIAKILEQVLEKQGAQVIMTRVSEEAIGQTKQADMAKRKEIIETSGQDLMISIHQNRFEDETVAGPQVFYYPGSEKGAVLANAIQQELNETLQPKNPRSALPQDYYVTRAGTAPGVIVECGFMSNPEEDMLLHKKEYQQMIVNGIVRGIEGYLKGL